MTQKEEWRCFGHDSGLPVGPIADMGWVTVDDARDVEANAKVDAEASGTEVLSVYDKRFQVLLDATQPGWT